MRTEGRTGAVTVKKSDLVQSFERGLAVIRAFNSAEEPLTLSDVARSTGLTRAAARRFLLTLVEMGYVGADGRLFTLRPRVLELGHAYLSSLRLPEVAQPHLEKLSATVNESSSMSVLDGSDIIYVARVAMQRVMTVAIAVGTRLPAHATSMGRVLLADLSPHDLDELLAGLTLVAPTPYGVRDRNTLRKIIKQVSDDGYAIVDQELELGLIAVAVPLVVDGKVAAALNVSTNVRRRSTEDMRNEVLPRLLDTAKAIRAEFEDPRAH